MAKSGVHDRLEVRYVSRFADFPLRKLPCLMLFDARTTRYGHRGAVLYVGSRARWTCRVVIYIERKICTFVLKIFTFSQNRCFMDAFLRGYIGMASKEPYSVLLPM